MRVLITFVTQCLEYIMKNKLIIFLSLLLLSSCLAEVNTVDPHNSESSAESKKDGFFIKHYKLYSSDDKAIIVEDAWLEKTWFYEIKDDKVIKVAKYGPQLCFKLKQFPNSKYNILDYDNWYMKFIKTRDYVGLYGGTYGLSFPDFNVPDTIRLEIGQIDKSNDNNAQVKTGEVIFVAR